MAKAKADPAHIKDLRPDRRNVRRHNPRNVGMIERSLQEVGAARSIVIDEDNNVLAGNGTIEAAGNVDITKLRVIDATGDEIIAVRRTGLTAKQKKSLALYDNRTAELADWDAEELARLQIEMPDALGPMFTQEELDAITDKRTRFDMMEPAFDDGSSEKSQFSITCLTSDADAIRERLRALETEFVGLRVYDR